MLSKARTAMDGLSDCAGFGRGAADVIVTAWGLIEPIDAHGRAIFFSVLLAGVYEATFHLALHLPPGVLGDAKHHQARRRLRSAPPH